MNDTTLVKLNAKTIKLREIFERMLSVNKDKTYFTLTKQQHDDYCAAIIDKNHVGNPMYRGIEIKKMN